MPTLECAYCGNDLEKYRGSVDTRVPTKFETKKIHIICHNCVFRMCNELGFAENLRAFLKTLKLK